jgi:hypothetical protein
MLMKCDRFLPYSSRLQSLSMICARLDMWSFASSEAPERVRILMNYSQQAGWYQNMAMRIYPRDITPACFNRGSSCGLAWIPDRSIRE